MSQGIIESFQEERKTLNDLVMKYAGLGTKRFYSLDSQAYREGALPVRTKELLGLVASFVLRCDDCIKYHTIRCHEEGVTDAEFEEGPVHRAPGGRFHHRPPSTQSIPGMGGA